MASLDEIRKAMDSAKTKPKHKFLSTGSALVNLAISGRADGGLLVGGYTYFVGDSSSGKSWLSLNCCAEACHREEFDHYDIVHDNAENGVLMDVERYFGKKTKDRLKAPSYDKDGTPIYSTTIEEFYFNLHTKLNSGKPCLYILDSMDSLSSVADIETFETNKKAHFAGKEGKGSYGMSKAKTNSTSMPHIVSKLEETGSILIIISQTRDNIGFGFNEKTRAGGKALKFYAHVEFWTSIIETIKKTVAGRPRPVGDRIEFKVTKNRVNGWRGKVDIPIYRSMGIDDIGGCIHWLVKEGYWKKSGSTIEAKELKLIGTEDGLAKAIQDKGLESKLYAVCQTVWDELEKACRVERKARYT